MAGRPTCNRLSLDGGCLERRGGGRSGLFVSVSLVNQQDGITDAASNRFEIVVVFDRAILFAGVTIALAGGIREGPGVGPTFSEDLMRFPMVLAASVLVVPLQAQSPATFDVVSIKANKSGAAASETDTTPGRLNLINVTPLSLLLRAFGVMSFQIIGAPAWLLTERYDVVATVPDGAMLTDQTRQSSLQKMLADRWRLRFHQETRTVPVYSLVASDDGSKLIRHTGPGEYAMKVERIGPRVVLRSTRGNLPRLVEILSGFSGRVVSNETGLDGEYDFTLDWVQDASANDP
jgi:uncharacterized protein (TIGR03435 family)